MISIPQCIIVKGYILISNVFNSEGFEKYKTDTNNKAKRLRATFFAYQQKLEAIEKSPILLSQYQEEKKLWQQSFLKIQQVNKMINKKPL